MSLELGTQSQNPVVRSFIGLRSCHEVPFTEIACLGDLLALPDRVELQTTVMASHGYRSAFVMDFASEPTRAAVLLYVLVNEQATDMRERMFIGSSRKQ